MLGSQLETHPNFYGRVKRVTEIPHFADSDVLKDELLAYWYIRLKDTEQTHRKMRKAPPLRCLRGEFYLPLLLAFELPTVEAMHGLALLSHRT
jgi:hypothetical protein